MQRVMLGFEVLQPVTLPEASAMLDDHGPDAKLLAGGTDLLIELRAGKFRPRYLVDLERVADARYLRLDEERNLRIGALATVSDVERSEAVAERFPALVETAVELGSRQIRNSATVVGNVCHASPSAEFSPPLIAAGAVSSIFGAGGERIVPLEAFFHGPGMSDLQGGEIVREICVPAPSSRTGIAYEALKVRKLMDIAVANAAAAVRLDESGTVCAEVRLALGGVAPIPFRPGSAEDVLRGNILSEHLIGRAAQHAAAEAKPITDVRGTREYREAIVARLTRRVLNAAIERARVVGSSP